MKKIKLLTSLFTISCLVPLTTSLSSCSKQKEETKRKVTLTGTTNADLTYTEDNTGMTINYNMHYDNLTVLYANVSINGTTLKEDEYKLDVVSTIKNIFIAKAILDKYPGDIVVDSKVEKKTVTSLEVKYDDKLHFQSKSLLLPRDISIKKIYNDKTTDKTFSWFDNDFKLLKNEQPIDDFYDDGYIFTNQNEIDGHADFVVQYSKDNVVAPLTIPVAKLSNPLLGVNLETPSTTQCYIKLSEDAKRLTGEITIPETLNVDGTDKTVIGIAPNGFYDSHASTISFANVDNITTISSLAFGQSTITKFNIPKTVTVLAPSAFNTCYKMTSLTFDDDSPITEIPQMCFFNCRSLTTIKFPKPVVKIARRAFAGCEYLQKATIQYTGSNAWIISGTTSQKINITNPLINAINLKNALADAQDNWGYTGIELSDLPA